MVYYLFVLSSESLQFFVGGNSCRTPQLFFHLEGVFHGSTHFPRKSCVLGGSLSAWQTTAFLGICFKFPRFLFWTSTRVEHFSWDFFHVWSPKSSAFPIRVPPKKHVVENKSCSSCSHNSGRSQPPQPCVQGFSSVTLIFSSAPFLLLQAQLIYLILSDVLLIVPFSETLM